MSLRLSLEDMLCGAAGPEPWVRQHFDHYIADIDKAWEPGEEEPVPGRAGYAFATSKDSVLLLYKEERDWVIVGYYNTPGAVCIHPDHQGKGLGAELILYTTVNWSEGPPTQHLDEQAFSPAGYAAHVAAWKLGVDRGLIVDPTASPRREPA